MAESDPQGYPTPPGSPVVVVVRPRSGSTRFPSAPAPKLAAPPPVREDAFANLVTPARSSTSPTPKSPIIVPADAPRRGSAPVSALMSPKLVRSSPLAQQSSTIEDWPAEDPPLPPLDDPLPAVQSSTSTEAIKPASSSTASSPVAASSLSLSFPKEDAPIAPISISSFLPPPVSPAKLAISKIPVNRPASPTSPPSLAKTALTQSASNVHSSSSARLSTLLRTQSIAGPSTAPPILNSKGEVIAAFLPSSSSTGSRSPEGSRIVSIEQRSSSMSADAPPSFDLLSSEPRKLVASLSSRELGQSIAAAGIAKSGSQRDGSQSDALISPKRTNSTLFGSAPLGFLLPTPPPAPTEKGPSNQRAFVVNELLQTERDYLADLEIVNFVFYKPLLDRKILSPKDMLSLFSNMEQIKDVNKTLLMNIETCMIANPNVEDVMLGDTFFRLADFLKVYTSYLQNQTIASDTLVRCEQSVPAFASFLKECMADPRCRGLSFLSFLIKPTQRISKYPLLLKELLKNTPEEHPDFAGLQKALKRIEEIVAYLNERKRESENQYQMLEIQSKLKADKPEESSIVSPLRRLVLEGTCSQLEKKELAPRRLYLFNDLLLAVKVEGSGKSEKYLVRGFFMLETVKIVHIADTPTVKYCIGIERNSEMHTFVCANEEEKSKWLKELRTLVKTFQKKALKSTSKE